MHLITSYQITFVEAKEIHNIGQGYGDFQSFVFPNIDKLTAFDFLIQRTVFLHVFTIIRGLDDVLGDEFAFVLIHEGDLVLKRRGSYILEIVLSRDEFYQLWIGTNSGLFEGQHRAFGLISTCCHDKQCPCQCPYPFLHIQ